MIPPDPAPKDRGLLPAVADAAGWSGFGPTTKPSDRRRTRSWAVAEPLPPPLLTAAVVLLDLGALAGAGLALRSVPGLDGRPALALIGVLAVLCLLAAGIAGSYGHAALFGSRRATAIAFGSIMASFTILVLAAMALGADPAFPPGLALLWLLLAAPPLLGGRVAASMLLRTAADRTRQRAVLVGDGPQAARFVEAMRARQDRSLRLLGVVDERRSGVPASVRGRSGLPHLGSLDVLLGMIRRGEVDQVVITLPWASEARLRHLEALLSDYPVDLRLAPDLAAYRALGATEPEAGHLRLLRLADRPMSGWAGLVKTVEDYVLAVLALAVAIVPMALIALAIRLDSPGPILFRQRRTGFNNRDFYVLKFRTMYHEHSDHDVRRQVKEGDPRVTPVGAILRRTSLDELPQLFNVLRGEMSFIGPRPHAPGTRAAGKPFDEVVARYAARHRVKPGLTGLAQVRGWRGPTDTEEQLIRRVESDLEYIENWSLWLDFVIVLRTLLAVACMRNAY
jgi:Undecaprenyl-phosphate glucose phosphotransferase